MADLRSLCSELPQAEPYNSVQPADLHDGEKFLDGAIRKRTEKSKLPRMRLSYGHIMVGNVVYTDSEKQEVLDRSLKVEAYVVGGEVDKNGDRVFEIYFSQYNHTYLVTLAFRPEERSNDGDEDEDSSHQEEEETCEVERDQQIGEEQKLTGKRHLDLYFKGELQYVVRFVMEKVEESGFLEEEDEFLFSGLQRIVGISCKDRSKEDQEDEIPVLIDDNSYRALPELVESEVSRKSTEEPDEVRTTEDGEDTSRIIDNPIPETEKGSEIETGAESADQSSDNFDDLDDMNLLERKNLLIARILRDLLQLHSSD